MRELIFIIGIQLFFSFFLSGKSLWYSADQMPDCCRCFPFGQLQFFNAVFQDLFNGGILLHLKETGAIKGGSNKVDLTVRTDETSLRVPHISLDCHGTPRSGFKRCFLSWMRKINPIIQMQMEFWNLAIFSWAMRGLAAMLNLVSFLCRDWSQRYSGVATYRHSWNCKPPRGVPGDAYQTHLCSDVKKKRCLWRCCFQLSKPSYCLTDSKFVCPCSFVFSTPALTAKGGNLISLLGGEQKVFSRAIPEGDTKSTV